MQTLFRLGGISRWFSLPQWLKQQTLLRGRKALTPRPAMTGLHALTSAALALPGTMLQPVHAAEDDTASFQYHYYEEGYRNLFNIIKDGVYQPIQRNRPIQANSIAGKTRIALTDRIKLAFNYVQDTWGGATPITTAPIAALHDTISGATANRPSIYYVDAKGNPYYFNNVSGQYVKDKRLSHMLVSASPETRKQGDFKLGYEEDERALYVGGGVSVEPDFNSVFVSANGRWDFNRKLTTLNAGVSYTSSAIGSNKVPGQSYIYQPPRAHVSGLGETLDANRHEWSMNLGLTQIMNKRALLQTGIGYMHTAGFLENPYKTVTLVFVDPFTPPVNGLSRAIPINAYEQRPDSRNQWNWNLNYVQHIPVLDAALHLDYRFFHDDWGINASSFETAWDQPMGGGWTITPRFRYYTQSAADFYRPYFFFNRGIPKKDAVSKLETVDFSQLPAHNFSSDHRLSAYGALGAGLTIGKRLAKGLSIEVSGEYYTHAGALRLGGAGEGNYADFDYFTLNAALHADLSALSLAGGGSDTAHAGHAQHDRHGAQAPAGVMFDHMLAKSGQFMAGYRYMYGLQKSNMLHGTAIARDAEIIGGGCGVLKCRFTPAEMNMNMHMLELMYAPADWLTLMLMPQFVDMNMNLRPLEDAPPAPQGLGDGHHHGDGSDAHSTGGIGDTGVYALVKLFQDSGQHVHLGLGISAPSGSVNEKINQPGITEGHDFIHYGMQLGSGTWDFKPSLTYTGQWDEWSWGGQMNATKRLQSHNASGFAFGDSFQATIWGGYSFTDWLSASVRGVYSTQGEIKGQFNPHRDVILNQDTGVYEPISVPNAIIGPMDTPGSYGGSYWDIGFGLSAQVTQGALRGNRFAFEWLQPLSDDVNGYQLQRQGALTATWSYGF